MLSGRLEWALDTDSKIFDGKTEAEFLAQSIKDVSKHYGGAIFDQKQVDWMNLIQCLAIVYGGRIYTIRSNPRIKSVRQPSPQTTAATHRPGPAPTMHRTPPPVNEFTPTPQMNGHDKTPPSHGHVAGVGDIALPDDHPLSPNFKPRWN